MHAALTIAGSDSGGGAGIQADLKTFAAHGVHGASAITAVTAQSTVAVTATHALPPEVVAAQIEAVARDITLSASKTGMLVNAAIVDAVADVIESLDLQQLVVDPVMVSTSGARLLDDAAVEVVRTRLLKGAAVVTPNRMEAEVLSGLSIATRNDAREAARRIHDLGPATVIVTGGHFAVPDDVVIDLLYDGTDVIEIPGPRVTDNDGAGHAHGTGCTYSAAVTAELACGANVLDAAQAAKRYVAEAIRRRRALGHGAGALHHFWSVKSA